MKEGAPLLSRDNQRPKTKPVALVVDDETVLAFDMEHGLGPWVREQSRGGAHGLLVGSAALERASER